MNTPVFVFLELDSVTVPFRFSMNANYVLLGKPAVVLVPQFSLELKAGASCQRPGVYLTTF